MKPRITIGKMDSDGKWGIFLYDGAGVHLPNHITISELEHIIKVGSGILDEIKTLPHREPQRDP